MSAVSHKEIAQAAGDGQLAQAVGEAFGRAAPAYFSEKQEVMAKDAAIVTVAALIGSGDLAINFDQGNAARVARVLADAFQELIEGGEV